MVQFNYFNHYVSEMDPGVSLPHLSVENIQEDEIVGQVFPSHDEISSRICKTFYYGGISLPGRDRPSLAMTELIVDHLADLKGKSGLDRGLSLEKAADVSYSACASPTCFLLSLIYLERLKKMNVDYLQKVPSADLFLISMMIASKFLNDDGEEDEVFNEEWAASAGLEKEELNALELEFLTAIDWRIYAKPEDFRDMTLKCEKRIAYKKSVSRSPQYWNTYTDLCVLSDGLDLSAFYLYTLKVSLFCLTTYMTSLMTLLGTCYLLNKTPLNPSSHLAAPRDTDQKSSPSQVVSQNETSSETINYGKTANIIQSIESYDLATFVPDDDDTENDENFSRFFHHHRRPSSHYRKSDYLMIFNDLNDFWDIEINKWKTTCLIRSPFSQFHQNQLIYT